MSFLAHFRLLQVVSRRFLLVVGRFRSFLARCRSFQVVPDFSKYENLSHNFFSMAYFRVGKGVLYLKTVIPVNILK